jgi:hypothetical protein
MNKLLQKLVLCGAALAMGNAYSHGTPIPSHGGVIQAVGETWLELVVKNGKIELYLEDDGDPMPSSGVSGTVSVAGKPGEFALRSRRTPGSRPSCCWPTRRRESPPPSP